MDYINIWKTCKIYKVLRLLTMLECEIILRYLKWLDTIRDTGSALELNPTFEPTLLRKTRQDE